MNATDELIARLGQGLQPVKRLAPPGLRAFWWLGSIALVSAVLIFGFSDLTTFIHRAADPKLVFELTGTLLTGVLAVVAAFELSLPDRSYNWVFLPIPSLLLWVGSSSYSCWRHWVVVGPEGIGFGEGAGCFTWIVVVGLPLAVSLFILLRRSRPLAPGPVAAMAGLGVASLAAFLLQFFHPFDITFIDLGLHFAGIAVVVVVARAAARPALAGASDRPI